MCVCASFECTCARVAGGKCKNRVASRRDGPEKVSPPAPHAVMSNRYSRRRRWRLLLRCGYRVRGACGYGDVVTVTRFVCRDGQDSPADKPRRPCDNRRDRNDLIIVSETTTTTRERRRFLTTVAFPYGPCDPWFACDRETWFTPPSPYLVYRVDRFNYLPTFFGFRLNAIGSSATLADREPVRNKCFKILRSPRRRHRCLSYGHPRSHYRPLSMTTRRTWRRTKFCRVR